MDDFARGLEKMNLSDATLDQLPETVLRPIYDRSKLTAGIVHIGLGNFHRAHQSWYLHRLMQQGEALDWAIVGAGVRQFDADMRERLLAQDCLTTLIELDPSGVSCEVVGSMIDYLPIEPDNRSLIARMSQPDIRIVSLTVTEGGYYLDPNTGIFDPSHPDIQHDVQNPDRPKTAFGAMVAALKSRRVAGHRPFTAMSCDNLQGNGAILRQCIVGLARLTDNDLALWIDEEGAFPNSMVDCIVPATTPDVIATARGLGVGDKAPVTHENFRQWVIEDAFTEGRPPWEHVGATLTSNVHSYESMKLRILNGGHQLLANIGEILSVPDIAACMEHELISAFFHKVESDEIVPYVQAVPEISASSYLELIENRFSNPTIRDSVRRVAFDGSSRHPGFLLPSLRDALIAGGPITGLAMAEALWARMCAGTREDGSVIEPNDPNWESLTKVAQTSRERPAEWLQQHYYGGLSSDERFSAAFEAALSSLWKNGAQETVKRYLTEPAP